MDANNLFPSRFLKAGDITTPITLTLDSIVWETMRDQTGKEVEKPVLYFAEYRKGLVLNRTNGETLIKLFGQETDHWKGKRVTLFTERVSAFGKTTEALRIDNKVTISPQSKVEGPTKPSIDQINALFGETDVKPQ